MAPIPRCGSAAGATASASSRIFSAATSPGIVSKVGAGVTDFKVGDAVFGVTDQGIEGAYAEKIAIKAAIVAKKPASLSHAEAAALGLISLTALTAIEDTAHLKAGETILIQGGAGGVAGFAVQLAKHLGATVITTASAGNHAYVRGLGADRVIDYNKRRFHHHRSDLRRGVRHRRRRRSSRLLQGAQARRQAGVDRAGAGRFPAAREDVETLRPDVKRDRAHLERLLELLDAGAVKPPAITRYKLADAAQAHRVSEARHLQGKLVLEVR